jgi:hypothetical protein
VPPESKQGDSRAGVCLKSTEQTPSPTSLLLTRRWMAAREKACGLRHNGPLSRDLCHEAAE